MLKVILGPLRRGMVLVTARTYRDVYVVSIETAPIGALAQVRALVGDVEVLASFAK
jgi:hypothetical protein